MDSNITIFKTYKKGFKLITGNFPVFNNSNYAGCTIPTTLEDKKTQLLNDLDENYNTLYIVGDDISGDVIAFYVDTGLINPITKEELIVPYNILV